MFHMTVYKRSIRDIYYYFNTIGNTDRISTQRPFISLKFKRLERKKAASQ